MGSKCVKILVLVALIPVALRATSLLLGGHGTVPATLPSPKSWRAATQSAGLGASAGSSVSKAYQNARPRRRRAEGTVHAVGTRPLRRVDAADWFEDDKRLAPTGANPLHNLRR